MSFTETFATTAQAVVALGADAAALAALPDDALLAAHTLLTAHRQSAQLYAAWLAGEIERRSSRDAGYSGLAQRKGFGSAHGLIQALSPITPIEATQLVDAGKLMASPGTLWESALSSALQSGSLAVAAADAIRRGLAPVADSARASELLAECERLIARVPLVTIDELRREARTARDRLDEAGIVRREKERRDNRYFKRWVRDDGMYQGAFLLDPESGLQVFSAMDAITAPRRGVRFVDPAAKARAQAVIDDPRTTEQLLADAFVEIVRLAGDADPGTLFGSHRPAVRVVVTEQSLAAGGHGFLEGDSQPVSSETIDRFVCDTGFIGIKFDRSMQIIDLGRTQRLFTEMQRLTISARDGGCIFLGCTKPPSASEVHHIVEWRNGGQTNVEDGVLLCRHHHMLLHNNGWEIIRDRDRYWLKPPRSEDPDQVLRPLGSKSPLMREFTT
ncbi:MAG: DUF222 domain-containing protein [Rhodoglobus sp.]